MAETVTVTSKGQVLRMLVKIHWAKEEDIPSIRETISHWLNWETSRDESLKRAVRNRELLVADHQGKVVVFTHYVMHEDIKVNVEPETEGFVMGI